ncbi:MAG: AAA family ATPase [Acidimicrobiaceae bacterium]|nr:AAA family ATPase [Acidimicrobiaceae bacterium]
MTEPVRRRPSKSSLDPRVPPHNLDAEQSALGAALLSKAAVEDLNALNPDDFYKGAHQHIATAVQQLAGRREDVDVVTVAEELRRVGLLDDSGGHQYLLELQNAMPAISNAHRYCRIVADTSALRQVIRTGAEICELGYSADDPTTVIPRAHELLAGLSVAPRAGWRIFAELSDVEEVEQVAPTRLRRTDGAFLLYEGRENGLQGEPASGKTWVALIAAAEVLAIGGTVVAVDLEDTPRAARARLRAIGVTVEQLARFLHTDARDVATAHELTLAELAATVIGTNPDMVLIDSISEAFSRWQLDEDKADDVNTFRDTLVKPLTRSGITVISLDHVAKSVEQRGRYARGSGAKLSGLDGAAYSVTTSGFNRTTGGRIYMKVAKDRHGALPGVVGDTVAQVWMPATIEGHVIDYRVEVPPPPPSKTDKTTTRTAADHQLHDELRTVALSVISKAKTPLSRRELLDQIRSRRRQDKLAGFDDKKIGPPLADLVAAGEIATIPGKGGHPAYALPPRQQTLLHGPEAGTK